MSNNEQAQYRRQFSAGVPNSESVDAAQFARMQSQKNQGYSTPVQSSFAANTRFSGNNVVADDDHNGMIDGTDQVAAAGQNQSYSSTHSKVSVVKTDKTSFRHSV